jgi:hypothetical protein
MIRWGKRSILSPIFPPEKSAVEVIFHSWAQCQVLDQFQMSLEVWFTCNWTYLVFFMIRMTCRSDSLSDKILMAIFVKNLCKRACSVADSSLSKSANQKTRLSCVQGTGNLCSSPVIRLDGSAKFSSILRPFGTEWDSADWRPGVRRVKGLLGLSPLGLISCLLRGQVSLACKSRNPLYIRRGDVSI